MSFYPQVPSGHGAFRTIPGLFSLQHGCAPNQKCFRTSVNLLRRAFFRPGGITCKEVRHISIETLWGFPTKIELQMSFSYNQDQCSSYDVSSRPFVLFDLDI
uniref:Uncharacterized protein n=1 Tax=Cacopsylla melanoneura TaxID=428564 RepID=A0A8D8V3E7_9HEMI